MLIDHQHLKSLPNPFMTVTIRVNTYQFYDKRIQSTQIVIKYFMTPQMPAPSVFFMTKVELLLLYSPS